LSLIIGPRRVALIGAIAAVVLVIIFYPLIVQTPIDLDKVGIELSKVEKTSGSQGEQSLNLRVTFMVTNNNDITLTTSQINYELFADGVNLGPQTLSYEDVPLNGRPALFSGTHVPLAHTFTVDYSDSEAAIFNKILNSTSDVKWTVTGSASIESGTTQETKDFSAEL